MRNPLEALFRVLTSVRFAIALVAFIVLSAPLGVALPQVPDFVRGDPTAYAQWLAAKAGAYWVFAPGMDRPQPFESSASFGSLLYDPWYDLEPALKDGDVDVKDLQKVFGRNGSTCAAPVPPQDPLPQPGDP